MIVGCCNNTNGVKLIYACSGSADVGELADRTARKLRDDGFGRMTCLAGIGADLSGFIESAKGAEENITIDGCPTRCAQKSLERVGVSPMSVMLADIGYKKGESPVTRQAVDSIASLVKSVAPSIRSTDGGSCCCK